MGLSDHTDQGSDGRYLLAASVLYLLLAGGAAWVALEISLATWQRITAEVFCMVWLLSAWRAYVRATMAKRF